MNSLISINIVTHNRERYLTGAIQSVLNQDYKNWELIIIDDASTDNTAKLIELFLSDNRIKYYLVEKQKNISCVRNIALSKSNGEYIAVLDSDDVWEDKSKLTKQVEFMEKNRYVVIVGSAASTINNIGKELKTITKPVFDEDIRKDFLTKNPFFHSSVIFRKEEVNNIGGYNEEIRYGEDLDLWLRLGKIGKLYNFITPFIKYRVHDDNESSKHPMKAILDVFKVINQNRRKYSAGRVVFLRKIFGKLFDTFKPNK